MTIRHTMMTKRMMITERLGESWGEGSRCGSLGQSWTCSSGGDGGGEYAGDDDGDEGDDDEGDGGD